MGRPARLVQLETLLRDLYQDLRLEPEEEMRLLAFRAERGMAQGEVADFERALLDRMSLATEHLRRGRSLVERGMFRQAEAEFRRATEIDPGDPLAWAQFGAVLATLGRDDEALGCYLHALALDPACWLAHYNLAVLRGRLGEVEAALASAGAALAALSPGDGPERSAVVRGLLEEPALAEVRRDPRFARVLASAPAAGEAP